MNKLLDVVQDEEAPRRGMAVSFDDRLSLEDKILPLGLYAAALANRLDNAQALFKQDANVNAKTNGFHCTALASASAYGLLDMVKLLIERGARVNEILPEDELAWKRRWNGFMHFSDREKSGRHTSAL